MGQTHFSIHGFNPLLLALALFLVAGCASTAASGDAEGDSRDVVSNGFGEIERDKLTTTVSSLKKEDLNTTHATSVEELLAGRVAGVEVIQTPEGFSVRIRGVRSIFGNNEPLYVVDGMPLMPGRNGIIPVNPHDVESIDVLKGAAAAVYGWRGGNGVIVIKTKRPR